MFYYCFLIVYVCFVLFISFFCLFYCQSHHLQGRFYAHPGARVCTYDEMYYYRYSYYYNIPLNAWYQV